MYLTNNSQYLNNIYNHNILINKINNADLVKTYSLNRN